MKKRTEMGCWMALAGLAIIPVGCATEGAVVALLWRWFMVPLHLPAIGFAHAFGLSALATVLTAHGLGKSEKKEEEEGGALVVKAYATMAGRYIAILAIAGTARLAMGAGW